MGGVTGHRSVLLVQDDDALRASLAADMRRAGLDVVEAETAYDAVYLLRQRPFDVVVTDVVLPGDGLHVLSETRARWPELPVLVVTACRRSTVLARAGSSAFGILLEPFALADFRDLLARALAVTGSASTGGRRPRCSRRARRGR